MFASPAMSDKLRPTIHMEEEEPSMSVRQRAADINSMEEARHSGLSSPVDRPVWRPADVTATIMSPHRDRSALLSGAIRVPVTPSNHHKPSMLGSPALRLNTRTRTVEHYAGKSVNHNEDLNYRLVSEEGENLAPEDERGYFYSPEGKQMQELQEPRQPERQQTKQQEQEQDRKQKQYQKERQHLITRARYTALPRQSRSSVSSRLSISNSQSVDLKRHPRMRSFIPTTRKNTEDSGEDDETLNLYTRYLQWQVITARADNALSKLGLALDDSDLEQSQPLLPSIDNQRVTNSHIKWLQSLESNADQQR